MSNLELMWLMVLMLAIGIALGQWSEARKWRKSADDYRRKQSGGKVYVVRREWA